MNRSKNLNFFIELISSVLKRPAMYEVNNIEDLNLLIRGFEMSCTEDKQVIEFMHSFRSHVNSKLETNEDVHWARLIRYHAGGDNNSLKLFEKYFFEFLNTLELSS